jgi:hypothetical protein
MSGSAQERGPAIPHSIEAERAVLGALLGDCGRFWPQAREALQERDLFTHAHQLVYRATTALVESQTPADAVSVFLWLQERGLAEQAGGLPAINDLQSAHGVAVTDASFAAAAASVRGLAKRRQAIAELDRLLRLATDSSGPPVPELLELSGEAIKALQAGAEPKRTRAPFARVSVVDLLSNPPAPPGFWWGQYLPAGSVTLLAAHGSTGKSLMGLMLAVCVALGRPMLGAPTRQGVVTFFSGEDAGDIVRYRLAWVCRCMGIDPEELDGRVHVLDATAGDPVLYHEHVEGGRRMGRLTPTYRALVEEMDANGSTVLIIDNASDVFDANEIDRARVREFVRSLAQIAAARGGAVLLLGHVAKSTSRKAWEDDEGYSGSTAWHNSVRSRLFLARTSDALELRHQKTNHGELQPPVRLVWPKGGLPTVDAPTTGMVAVIEERNTMRTLLAAVADFNDRGESLSTATSGPGNGPSTLKGWPGLAKVAEITDLMRDAERRGWLQREAYRNASRKEKERWLVTSSGRQQAGLQPSAPVAPVAPVPASGANQPTRAGAAPVAPVPALGGMGDISAHTESPAHLRSAAAPDAQEAASDAD